MEFLIFVTQTFMLLKYNLIFWIGTLVNVIGHYFVKHPVSSNVVVPYKVNC